MFSFDDACFSQPGPASSTTDPAGIPSKASKTNKKTTIFTSDEYNYVQMHLRSEIDFHELCRLTPRSPSQINKYLKSLQNLSNVQLVESKNQSQMIGEEKPEKKGAHFKAEEKEILKEYYDPATKIITPENLLKAASRLGRSPLQVQSFLKRNGISTPTINKIKKLVEQKQQQASQNPENATPSSNENIPGEEEEEEEEEDSPFIYDEDKYFNENINELDSNGRSSLVVPFDAFFAESQDYSNSILWQL